MTLIETAALGEGACGVDDSRQAPQDLKQWTIKGIDAEIVEKARTAAKKKGMKIGAWVAATIANTADTQISEGNPSNGKSPLGEDILELLSKIEESRLEEKRRIERMESDLSMLIRGQHGLMAEILARKS